VKKARRAGPHLLRHPQWSEGKPCNHSVPGGVQMAFMWVEQARACLAVARPERRCQVDDRYPDLPAPRAGRAHAANSPRKRLTGCRDVPRRTGPASAPGASSYALSVLTVTCRSPAPTPLPLATMTPTSPTPSLPAASNA